MQPLKLLLKMPNGPSKKTLEVGLGSGNLYVKHGQKKPIGKTYHVRQLEDEVGSPCDKGPIIDAVSKEQEKIRAEQMTQYVKLDLVLQNQQQFGQDIKQAIDGLTRILLADIETRKDVEQLKKDREILFDLQREDAAQIARINQLADRYTGAGIYENYPKLWNWFQQHEAAEVADDTTCNIYKAKVDVLHNWYLQEMGWRRFIPGALTIVSTFLVIYVSLVGLTAPMQSEAELHSHRVEKH